MRYQYNFGFLAQWSEANPKLAKGALQKAIGSKSNNRIKAWTNKKGPMPVLSMLRFCNTFNVPISAFFRDIDANTHPTVIPLPNINDQLEPDGGYASDPNDRQHGERSMLDPVNVTHIPSVIPYPERLEYSMREEEETNRKDSSDDTAFSRDSLQAILNLENTHAQQRQQLLDMIAALNDRIRELNNENKAQAESIAELNMRIQAMSQNPPFQVIREYTCQQQGSLSVAEKNGQ